MMESSKPGRAAKLGLPPGTLVHVGEVPEGPATLHVIDYDRERVEERDLAAPADIRSYIERPSVTWVNVIGVHDAAVMAEIGEILEIHPLVLEDVMNTHQRPKAEELEGHLFIVIKMLLYDEAEGRLKMEQVSMVLGRGIVITFQERPGDVFDPIRQRIRTGKGRLRNLAGDYLAYALLDVLVDHYFIALEEIGAEIEQLEEAVIGNPEPAVLSTIHTLRRTVHAVRRVIWPLRDLAQTLDRVESDLIQPSTHPYLRDVYDHAAHAVDTVETYREAVSGYLDLYLSSVSHRMNEVMKVLTVMATLFIPLTFIAGIYGMNFEYMPELTWRWGYAAVWVVMLGCAGGMLFFFRRKKWF